MQEPIRKSHAKPLPSRSSDEKLRWWTSKQRNRSSLHKISRADAIRLWGKEKSENFDRFDELEIVIDPEAPLETGAAVAMMYSDGSGPGLGILRTKDVKRAKLFSVDVLRGSGQFDLAKNTFPRDWIAVIVGVEATEKL